ncbi:MAG: hypothetical protein HZB56_10970 [Deltaproteobacteria bacterium]|nr:hypothetical protein [Deltaproteobacteria bacterium]
MWEQTKSTFLAAVASIVQTFARLLPGILAMLLLVLVSVLVALVARGLLRRVCARLDVDRRLREWGMAAPAVAGRAGPSQLIARLGAWTVVATGFLVGLSVLESTAASSLALRLLDYVPHAVVGLVIVVAGLAGSRAVERSVLIGAVNMGLHSARLLGLGARWLVQVLAGAMALEQLGIGGTILTAAFAVLFGGIVLSLSLAVGLGSRDIVARSLEKRLEQGDKADTPAGGQTHHL